MQDLLAVATIQNQNHLGLRHDTRALLDGLDLKGTPEIGHCLKASVVDGEVHEGRSAQGVCLNHQLLHLREPAQPRTHEAQLAPGPKLTPSNTLTCSPPPPASSPSSPSACGN